MNKQKRKVLVLGDIFILGDPTVGKTSILSSFCSVG